MEEAAEDFLSKIPVQPISPEAASVILSHMAEDTPLALTVWPYTDFPIWNYETLRSDHLMSVNVSEALDEPNYNKSDPLSVLRALANSTTLKNANISQESALRVGGRMKDGMKVRVEVYTHFERRPTHDVFGIVRGAVEPDRLVIMGSHRDAWGPGAVDPGGGTATMLEISRVVGQQIKEGWRPRRTLLFASWGAEEFGLIGSTEWVEEKLRLLRNKAVAYLNLDIIVTGHNVLNVAANPVLHDLIYESAKEIPHPEFPNLFEAWKNYTVSKYKSFPRIRNLLPDSDFAPFFFSAGVPSMSIFYAKREFYFYPTYHTNYDTFDYIKRFIDPTFVYHRLMGQFFVNMLHKLLDSTLLPMTTRHYSTALDSVFKSSRTILDLFFAETFPLISDLWEKAEYCVKNFTFAANDYQKMLDSLDKSSPLAVRIANDKLMLLERAFLDDGWKQRTGMMYPHVLFGPSDSNCVMVTTCCPGLSRGFCGSNFTSEAHKRLLEEEVSVLCHALYSAIDLLII